MARYPRSATRKTFQKVADAVAALGGTIPPETAAPKVRALLADHRLAGRERGQADDIGGCHSGLERKYGWDSLAGTIYGPFRIVRLKASPQPVLVLRIDACNAGAGEMFWARQEDLDAEIAEHAKRSRPLPVIIDARALTLPEIEALYAGMDALSVSDTWSNSWRMRLTLEQALDVCRIFIERRQQTQAPWPFYLSTGERRDLWDAKASVLLNECLRPQILPQAQRIIGLFDQLKL
ncbi:hypothetical protein [Microvirga massiliensis]|uniref:hypothetical protein n=1 Tax=Microvirga massiliensis TaxID=1033741 RepID=UPI00062BEBC0|nr:hypothetical protein [Microvirga massiliensis]